MNAGKYDLLCKLCGEHFIATYKNTWYCPECKVHTDERRYRKRCDTLRKRYQKEARKKYNDGITYVCIQCGRTIMVHERTSRKTCDECMSKTAYGRKLLKSRKFIQEEVVDNGTVET